MHDEVVDGKYDNGGGQIHNPWLTCYHLCHPGMIDFMLVVFWVLAGDVAGWEKESKDGVEK